jgi:predicted NAD-dependent protein-ADP-ribosyltransferase YbiA (DUF1768 family)
MLAAHVQYAKNAKQLQSIADEAKAKGRKVRGQTAEYWQTKASDYARYAAMTDDEMRAHLTSTMDRIRAEVEAKRATR